MTLEDARPGVHGTTSMEVKVEVKVDGVWVVDVHFVERLVKLRHVRDAGVQVAPCTMHMTLLRQDRVPVCAQADARFPRSQPR